MKSTFGIALGIASILLPTLASADPEKHLLPTPEQVAQSTVNGSGTPNSPVVVENYNNDTGYDSVNYVVLSTGAVAFLGTYIASVIVAANSNTQGDNRLYWPVAGPWLDLADRRDCGGFLAPCDRNENTYKGLLIADGIVQGLGILTILDGLIFPVHHYHDRYAVRPVQMNQGSGLALTGRF